MGRSTMSGIYRDKEGNWCVDKFYKGTRLREHFGADYGEAESWLIHQLDELRKIKLFGYRQNHTFDEAAAKYLDENQDKLSIKTEIYLLEPVMQFIGDLSLEQVHDDTLKPFVKKRKADGLKHKTINLSLEVVRKILNLAARNWRDVETGQTWLATAPAITMLPLQGFQREPTPITWQEQRKLLPLLPQHLQRMALFMLQCGARDRPICNLKWEWEIKLPKIGVSVFVVPKEFVKGRKEDRVIVCNSVAQSIIESVRGMHPEYVFVYLKNKKKGIYLPTGTMNNTAWQKARTTAGLGDLHVHDLRHTVGMRLREAGVNMGTIADILWHVNRVQRMTTLYSEAQCLEILNALELIKDEANQWNKSLSTLIREARGETVPQKSPCKEKAARLFMA